MDVENFPQVSDHSGEEGFHLYVQGDNSNSLHASPQLKQAGIYFLGFLFNISIRLELQST